MPGEERATGVREHLANERTLLSWVRTGVGLISLGIVGGGLTLGSLFTLYVLYTLLAG